jgi:hypothetical protein
MNAKRSITITPTTFEREPCKTCDGTGSFRGGECYRCLGSGMQLTVRGAAAKAYYEMSFIIPGDQVQKGDFIWLGSLPGGQGFTHGNWVEVTSIGEDGTINTRKRAFRPDRRYRISPRSPEENEAALAQALAYQDTLDIDGTPRNGA